MRLQLQRLNSVLRALLTSLLCITSSLVLTLRICGQEPQNQTKPRTELILPFRGTLQFGGQFTDVQGAHTGKFEEYKDVPRGIFLEALRFDFNNANSHYSFAARGYEIRERDQRVTVEFEKIGKLRSFFMWDQIPRTFGTGQSFLTATAPGLYRVSADLRTSLQAVTLPDAGRTPVNAALPNLVRERLRFTPLVESRLRRDEALFRQTFKPSENVELYAQFSWVRNRGTRPMSAGTFLRRAVPAPGIADIGGFWEGVGQEYLEPIDTRTYDFRAGILLHGKRWRAGAEYRLSLFRNHIDSLTFENPFRVTDEEGCLPNNTPPTFRTCGSTNRFKEVRWQNDLVPNNDSHTISLWASFDATEKTQMRALFSLAYWTQNDPFLSWTLNTAIVPTHWDTASPVTNPTDVNQLPASSANAKMRNINQEFALVNRHDTFRFQAQYRSQYLDSQTPTLDFPGYAAFGDSTWRSPVTDFLNLPIENLDWDFRRQNVDGSFQWDVFKPMTWKVDYGWEIWNRKFRDVNRNNDQSIRNRLDFEWKLSGEGTKDSPSGTPATGTAHPLEIRSLTLLRLKLDYRYANRKAIAYNTQPLSFNANFPGSPPGGPTTAWEVTSFTRMKPGVPMEFNQLRRFDEANRIRHDASFTVELLKGEKTNASASYRYLSDDYDKNFYGLLFNHFQYIDTQLTHLFENGSFLYATYSREINRYSYRDLGHLLPAPTPPPGAVVRGSLAQYPIANTWERTSRSNLDSFEFGYNAAPHEGRLKDWQFDIAYALSFTRDRISTFNPFTVRADSVLHAGANPYPDTTVRRQDVNVLISRRITENVEIGGRYWYEPYIQDDFSYNVLAPYVHGNLTSDTPKYLFQDARYGSYHANVASVFVRYSF